MEQRRNISARPYRRAGFLLAAAFGVPVLLVAVFAAAGAAMSNRQLTSSELAMRNFVSQCGYSHESNDDPIRFPGQVGRTHNHTFIGNSSTNARSTAGTLARAESNCDRPGDKSGYWAPTLFVAGKPVYPTAVSVYYRRTTNARVVPFPQGLDLVAGNQLSTKPQSKRVTFWQCSSPGLGARTSSPPSCGTDRSLQLHVVFPSCWDGRVDSIDDTSHLAYPSGQRCPPRHSVSLPTIEMVLNYPKTAQGHPQALASGGVFSAHADFMNAWSAPELKLLIDVCLNQDRVCGRLPPPEVPGQ